MKQYIELLNRIMAEGTIKPPARTNMPRTIGITNAVITHDLKDGFPLLTTKKMFRKGIIHELLWFLRGDTNIKYLVDNGVYIWNGDAYRWYLTKMKEHTDSVDEAMSELSFIATIKASHKHELERWFMGSDYKLGDLGKVYGYQWRNQNGVDQVADVLEGLHKQPFSRYHIIDGWNKADFKDMALPPCHLLYQFIVRYEQKEVAPRNVKERLMRFFGLVEPKRENDLTKPLVLDLNMYQRSCDTFLGVPFNIASMALLLHIFAKASKMTAGTINWLGGDTHIYETHIEQVAEQTSRTPYDLCTLHITKEISCLDDIEKLTIDDFVFDNYVSHSAIKAELSVGL